MKMKSVVAGCLAAALALPGSDAFAASYKIKAVVKSGKGSVSGAGTYAKGKTATLKAKPASGYRFLRWASCCEAFSPEVESSSTLKYEVYGSSTLYAYFKKKPAVPKPSVKRYSTKVKLTWKKSSGAVSYKIRRGKSKTYSKSTVIASGVTGTSFNDEHCWEEGSFYYWVVPVDSTGKSFYSKSKYRAGRAALSVKVGGSSSLTVGESEQYQVFLMCSLLSGKYKWKIVSGTKYATISSTGVLKAKKAGKVVIQCTYKGKSAKKTVIITKDCPSCSE